MLRFTPTLTTHARRRSGRGGLRVAVPVLLAAFALVGSGRAAVPITHAAPTGILAINQHVADALAGSGIPAVADLTTPAGRTAAASNVPLATLAQQSAGQVSSDPAHAGNTVIIVQVNDPSAAATVALNGKGLVCSPACDNSTAISPDGDNMVAFTVTGTGSFVSGTAVTATQDSVSVDSPPLTLVGAGHDMNITLTKLTVQEGASSCGFNANTTAPTTGEARAVYTDINGNALVGYVPTIASGSTATAMVANAPGTGAASQTVVSMLHSDSGQIAGTDRYCGEGAGSTAISAPSQPGEIEGLSTPLTRNFTLTVTGVPATIALTASPASLICDGTSTSTVTATVMDSAGNDVVGGTPVTFSVVALGTSNPINTTTSGGTATSVITPLSGDTSGVVVTVTSGAAASSIRIDCASQPVNGDAFSHPIPVTTLPFTGILNTTGFTTELNEPLPCGSMGATAWYQLILPVANVVITADTAGSNFNTALAVYSTPPTSPPGGLSLLGCNASSSNSSVTFVPTPGTYYIQVGGVSGATGALALNLRCSNDSDCDGLSNADEAAAGTNPLLADTDGDGLSDGLEVHTYHTNPLVADTDGDGYPDGLEVALGKDPLTYCATMRADLNGDGTVNIVDLAQLSAFFLETTPPAPARDDQNNDGKLNIIDLTMEGSQFLHTIGTCK